MDITVGIIMGEIMYISITETILITTTITKCGLIRCEIIRPIIDTIPIEEEHLQARDHQQEILVHQEEHAKVRRQVRELQTLITIEEVLQILIIIEVVLQTPILTEEDLHQEQAQDKWEAVLEVWEAEASAVEAEEEDKHSLKQMI